MSFVVIDNFEQRSQLARPQNCLKIAEIIESIVLSEDRNYNRAFWSKVWVSN